MASCRSAVAAGEQRPALEELRPLFTRRTGFGLSFEYITAEAKVLTLLSCVYRCNSPPRPNSPLRITTTTTLTYPTPPHYRFKGNVFICCTA